MPGPDLSDIVRSAAALAADRGDASPSPGIGLCLSGGGYRAMPFHAGVLWRLNELGMLSQLKRISSVSGGSITAAQLGLRWTWLGWRDGVATTFQAEVVAPIRALASRTIDEKSIIRGALQPRTTVSDRIVSAYRRHLFGDATLQDLPDDSVRVPPPPLAQIRHRVVADIA